MKVTIGLPPAFGHGDKDVLPDMPEAMSIEDAIYHTVHTYPGGVQALAARMGVSANTLTHKANPNNATHHCHPRELVTMQHMSGNTAILHAMAHALDRVVSLKMPDRSNGDPVDAYMRLQVEWADLLRALADPLTTGKPVTRNELRRAEYHAAEVQSALANALITLRSHVPKAPGEV